MFKILLPLITLSISLQSFSQNLVDKQANTKTSNLYQNLATISDDYTLFGHQYDMAYGVNLKAKKGRSDVRETVGSYPAVHGWEVASLEGTYNIDSVKFSEMKVWIREVYQRGGINSFTWHLNELAKGGAFGSSVKDVLPAGSRHSSFLEALDYLASFAFSLKVPILFNLFDGHNSANYWWGKTHCEESEFIALWKFTVDYLKEIKKVHNFIYVYSPEASVMDFESLEKDYFYGYPGDDYVDALAVKAYNVALADAGGSSVKLDIADFINVTIFIDQQAKSKHKLAAVSETGQNQITDRQWFTKFILASLRATPGIKISWITFGANSDSANYYIPFEDHPAVSDFRNFRNSSRMLFENDLEKIYE